MTETTTNATETITLDEALDRIEAAAEAHSHGYVVGRDATTVYLSRELSRGRRQQVGSIELLSDGTEVEVEVRAHRQRATLRDIARDALSGVTVQG